MTATVEELSRLLSSGRSGERLAALNAISTKVGGGVVRLIDDPRTIEMLITALSDRDRRVQRAAARGLRPWLAEVPGLLDDVLRAYAGNDFDGSYSHAGLLDTRSSTIWVPRFAALKGHAALLPDANTDRFFRFDLFVAGQVPNWLPAADGAHLVMYFVPDWSYSRQALVSDWDEHMLERNRREQQRYGDTVAEFYASCALPYDVRVHHVSSGGGHHRSRELNVGLIKAKGG
jgi:hypothetical protein